MHWKNVLLVHDGTENGDRAVEYVARMLRETPGVKVTLLGLHEHVPDHDFKATSPVVGKLEHKISSMETDVEKGRRSVFAARETLLEAGFATEVLSVRFVERKIAAHKAIGEEAENSGAGTIVIGNGSSGAMLAGGVDLARDLLANPQGRAVCVI